MGAAYLSGSASSSAVPAARSTRNRAGMRTRLEDARPFLAGDRANPKGITFFVAFLPQFLDRNGDFWTQMLIFEATFIWLAFANAIG